MKQLLANILSEHISFLTVQEILKLIERPKYQEQGDFSFPCFALSKHLKKNPRVIAEELKDNIERKEIKSIQAINGYLNVFFAPNYVGLDVINDVLQKGESVGEQDIGQQQVVTMDISSPNIAKPFSMGHLRSTVIGNAMALIMEKLNYQPVKINHLGDWGTQFGKLIVAYQKWGDKDAVTADPIPELFKLYVKFHEAAEHDEKINEEGRHAFLMLEQNHQAYTELWQWFREVSLNAFNQLYQRLNITFDSYNGEAFYNDKMESVVELLKKKHLLVLDHGAEVVKLSDMPPALIKKNNGSTLYITRDLATAIYRKETYDFSYSYYFVGNEQSLHFKQLIEVLKLMGYQWANHMKHISFGMILKDGKKMSTRKGKVIFLEDVLNEAVALAKSNIKEKSTKLKNIDEVSEQVGIGAVIFNDLKHDRQNDIEFNLEEMLKPEGNTCLYLQYTNARIHAIIRKANVESEKLKIKNLDKEAWDIVKTLDLFDEVLISAMERKSPAELAKYLLQLARRFNTYYAKVRILDDQEMLNDRIGVLLSVSTVIEEGLRLLGIKSPREL
ncbi:arginine--tRNA ligase [Staphylococcus coagulans]|uniref:arginine--tRNA ligase n=1 Tax=Staphylococcus coagulans TaxID=74706 RepID=UPI001BEA8808|nr:arginine--tRNA ligase [Staphylococcus coagulans]MBT2814825.1 arginine--tRNA ligase [Staphylococcus coagulans]MBT2817014.1 arginine--tRNA ligase [Staphylococcus coagulans]MBT2837653.1 arginine--tRNA ligase [Staphylococcus coagulans]MBT2842325.1 arginine--tRNA ligase [Staphylococcus coagulans]MBT2848922.1 arginine--tRNA ligase [Staphylococcus coagulans]